MTNLEKYAEEIKNYKGYEFCKDFVKVKILNPLGLKCDIGCSRCDMLQMMWNCCPNCGAKMDEVEE